jgi:hypothetical protein
MGGGDDEAVECTLHHEAPRLADPDDASLCIGTERAHRQSTLMQTTARAPKQRLTTRVVGRLIGQGWKLRLDKVRAATRDMTG